MIIDFKDIKDICRQRVIELGPVIRVSASAFGLTSSLPVHNDLPVSITLSIEYLDTFLPAVALILDGAYIASSDLRPLPTTHVIMTAM